MNQDLNLWIKYDIEKSIQRGAPYILFGIGLNEDREISNLGNLSDEQLEQMNITIKSINELINLEYLHRIKEKEELRKEIDEIEKNLSK